MADLNVSPLDVMCLLQAKRKLHFAYTKMDDVLIISRKQTQAFAWSLVCAFDMGTPRTSIEYSSPLQCFIGFFINGIVNALRCGCALVTIALRRKPWRRTVVSTKIAWSPGFWKKRSQQRSPENKAKVATGSQQQATSWEMMRTLRNLEGFIVNCSQKDLGGYFFGQTLVCDDYPESSSSRLPL